MVKRQETAIREGDREAVRAYLEKPVWERVTQRAFIKETGIVVGEYYRLKSEYLEDQVEKLGILIKARKVQDILGTDIEESKVSLAAKVKQLDSAVFEAGQKNSKMAELWYKRKGLLVEKQEVRIGLTADEIARRNFEADKQLREAGYTDRSRDGHRVEEVSA